jgi:hypothetical protein
MSILVITVDLVLASNTPQLAAICHSGESRNPEVILEAGSVIPDPDPGPA